MIQEKRRSQVFARCIYSCTLNINPHVRFIAAVGAGSGSLDLFRGFRRVGCFGIMAVIMFKGAGKHHLSFIAAIFTFAHLLDFFNVVVHASILLVINLVQKLKKYDTTSGIWNQDL
jgi:hypothetical protein